MVASLRGRPLESSRHMIFERLQVFDGVDVEKLPFARYFNCSHALLVGLGHIAAAFAKRQGAKLVKRPGGKQHRSA